MKRYIKVNKYISVILAVLLVSILIVPTSYSFAKAQNPIELNTKFKLAFISTPAYYCVEVSSNLLPSKRYNSNLNTPEIYSYVNLTDTEFKVFAKKRIVSLIQMKKSKNSNFIWNKEFLKDFVRPLFPTLYYEIINNNNHEKITISGKVSNIVSNNGEYHTQTNFIVYPKTLLGTELAEFDCRIYWSWNSTEILSVLPSTWGEVFAPGFSYKGVVSNTQYFYNNRKNFKKIVKGDFTYTYPTIHWVRHYYPTLNITLYLGGDITVNNYGW